MKIVITGAGGLVGRAVANHFTQQGEIVIPLDHHALDISDAGAVNAVLHRERPEALINCAAWTDVDACESDHERAVNSNTRGPAILALGCQRIGALLVTLSTDYVF